MIEDFWNWIKNNKYKSAIIAIVLVILIAWPGRKVEPKKEIKMTKIKSEDLKIESLTNRIGMVNWQTNDANLPEKTNIIENKSGKIGKAELLKLSEWLGLGEMTTEVDEPGLLLYKETKGGSTVYVNLDNNVVYFGRGFLGNDFYQKIVSEEDIRLAKDNFEILIKKLNGWIDGGRIQTIDTYYQKIVGPRAVTAGKSEAMVINVEASVIDDGKKLLSSYGRPLLTARYGSKGVLLELKIENIRLMLKKGEEFETLKWNEIKNTDNNQIKIFSISGPENFERSQQNDDLKIINITSVEIDYVYSPAKNSFWPFLIGEGNCQLDSGPARIRLGTALWK